MKRFNRTLSLLFSALTACGSALPAEPAAAPSYFETVTVTATGSATDAFDVAPGVSVISADEIARRMPDNAADLLREEVGVDVNGVGPNQPRPIIRGQRGLRVLLLDDGLRLNNPRRQTDFGEITSLVDVGDIEALEIVRGPASVLYGSDAIGGVLNFVERRLTFGGGGRVAGRAGIGYGTAGDSLTSQLGLSGSTERFAFDLGGSFRSGNAYDAPAGRFGDIRLAGDTLVGDTGLGDSSTHARLGVALGPHRRLTLRVNRYRAQQTGFGLVDPKLYAEDDSQRVRILYPYQRFDRLTVGYEAEELRTTLADTFEIKTWLQKNERELANDIDINIGPIFPFAPDSFVAANTLNYTDLDTRGARLQASKVIGARQLWTYGFELTEDDSFNTDQSSTTTTLNFPGPPFSIVDVAEDDTANTPNATQRTAGLFAQSTIRAHDRLQVSVGARFQRVDLEAEPTPGWEIESLEFNDRELVGAASFVYTLRSDLRLVGSYGTAFRSPNIVERLFNGITPEGFGYQVLNTDLTSERGVNYDAGLKFRRGNAFAEAMIFRNDIRDGIIQVYLGPDEIAELSPETQDEIDRSGVEFVVQQRNVDRLRYEGLELSGGYRWPNGLSLTANWTSIDGEREGGTPVPIQDSVSDKIVLAARYQPTTRPYWIEYRARRNGSAPTEFDPNAPPPAIGKTLPSFAVHSIGAGVRTNPGSRLRQELAASIENLTDELYAEFSNAQFFRPEPGRRATVSYRIWF